MYFTFFSSVPQAPPPPPPLVQTTVGDSRQDDKQPLLQSHSTFVPIESSFSSSSPSSSSSSPHSKKPSLLHPFGFSLPSFSVYTLPLSLSSTSLSSSLSSSSLSSSSSSILRHLCHILAHSPKSFTLLYLTLVTVTFLTTVTLHTILSPSPSPFSKTHHPETILLLLSLLLILRHIRSIALFFLRPPPPGASHVVIHFGIAALCHALSLYALMSALVSLSPGVACAVLSLASLILNVPTAQQCRVPPFVRKALTTQLPFVALCCLATSSSPGGAIATTNATATGTGVTGDSEIAATVAAGVVHSAGEGGGYGALVFSMVCYALFLIIAPKRRLVVQSSSSSSSSSSHTSSSPVEDDLSAATAAASFMLTLAFCSRSAFQAAFELPALFAAILISLLITLTSHCATVLPLVALPCAFATAAPLALVAGMALTGAGMGSGGTLYYYMTGVGVLAACVLAALSLGVANALRKAADDAVGLAGVDDIGGGVWYVNDGSGTGMGRGGSMGMKGAQRGWVEMMLAMMPPMVGVIPNSAGAGVGGAGKR